MGKSRNLSKSYTDSEIDSLDDLLAPKADPSFTGNVGCNISSVNDATLFIQDSNTGAGTLGDVGANKGTIFISNPNCPQGQDNIAASLSFGGADTNRRRAMIASYNDHATDIDPTGLIFAVDGSTTGSNETVNEAMRIDSSGNVGIGESDPDTRLHVTATNPTLKLEATANNNAPAIEFHGVKDGVSYTSGRINSNAGRGALQLFADPDNNSADTSMEFYVDGSERMRIDTAGRVTMPYQPVAWIRFSGTTLADNWQKITSYQKVHDVGGHYNLTSSRYTIPTTGTYIVNVGGFAASSGSTERYALGVYKNGSLQQFVGGNLSAVDTPLSGGSFAIPCSTSDYLEIYMYTAVSMTLYAGGNHSVYANFYLLG